MRLVIARCSVDYAGRLAAHLPEANRLIMVKADGWARRLLEKGLPETRGGPRWAPEGEGIFAVLDDAGRANPLLWVPLDPASPPQVLVTGTELNADPFPLQREGTLLLFTAQGKGEEREKRWRRIFVARLIRGGAK